MATARMAAWPTEVCTAAGLVAAAAFDDTGIMPFDDRLPGLPEISETQHETVGQIEHEGRLQVGGEDQRQHGGAAPSNSRCRREPGRSWRGPVLFHRRLSQRRRPRTIAFSLIGRLISAANTPSATAMPQTML